MAGVRPYARGRLHRTDEPKPGQFRMNGSLSRSAAVFIKEITQLRRDRLTFAMMVMIPLMQLLLFGYAINTDPKELPTAVVDLDGSRFSRSFLSAMEETGYFRLDRKAGS